MRLFHAITGLALLAATAAFAAEPHYGRIALTTEGSTAVQAVFAPDTPKIVLHVEILDMPKGTKIAADWIAVKTDVAPANYKIDSAGEQLAEDVASDEKSFSLSKPDNGWPVGDYRIDLTIADKVAKSVPFQVAN